MSIESIFAVQMDKQHLWSELDLDLSLSHLQANCHLKTFYVKRHFETHHDAFALKYPSGESRKKHVLSSSGE